MKESDRQKFLKVFGDVNLPILKTDLVCKKQTYSDNKMLMIQVLLSRIYAIQIKNNNPRFILSQSGRANKVQIASQNLNRKVKKYYYKDCLIKKQLIFLFG